ncbi:MAG TPA: helix-turn-helix transcriptional regulator [Dehalococcoidia bacterium]|nr:helix-turn-helix transcriptional regulator [Dehalococcoidia bacterium]
MWSSIRALAPRVLAAAEVAAALAVLQVDGQLSRVGIRAAVQLGPVARSQPRVPERSASARQAAPNGLTPREREVLQLLAEGKSNHEIAATLVVSVRTVDHHLAKIYRKTGARGRVTAATYALRLATHDLTVDSQHHP